MKQSTVIIVSIVCVISALFLVPANNLNLFDFSYPQITNQSKQILQNQNNTLIVLASTIEDELNQAIDILNITAQILQ